MKKTLLISMLLVLAALMLFVSCKKDPEVTNADRFLESYNAADFVLNDFVKGVWGYEENDSTGTSGYNQMNYCYSATVASGYSTDPQIEWYGTQNQNLFTNEAKTKRVGLIKFTNYGEYVSDPDDDYVFPNGRVVHDYQKVEADGINLEFKYKDQTSSDGTTWTDSSAEKTGYFLCNAVRTKKPVEGSTTKYTYTVTDLKLSVKKVNGEWLDVSSKTEVEYKSISYEMDGTDLSTLSNLTYDGTALTSTEIKAVIDALK
jgi:hypothetical protein